MSYFSRILAQFLSTAGVRTNVTPQTPLPITLPGGQGDAFGRVRISHPETLFDSKQLFDKQPLLWDESEVSGSGTSGTHSTDEASVTMQVTASTAGKLVRQTFRRFNYEPGKSQLVNMTGVLDETGGGTGIVRAFGLFDDDNGIFLEDNEGTIQLVRRTSVTGSPVDNSVAQASWNLDTMDGDADSANPSGVNLDWTKTQILVIDLEWLGVGRVRVGFNVDGVTYYVHEFLNANNLATVYISTPNLPLRYEIENLGTGIQSTLVHICSTVISEGGTQSTGTVRYKSTQGTEVSANTGGTIYPVVGIRLKSTHLDAVVDPVGVSLIAETSDDFEWLLVINPNITGTFTFTDQTNSCVQAAVGATATAAQPDGNPASNGVIVGGGFARAGNQVDTLVSSVQKIGSSIAGTPDELVLCVRPMGTGVVNADIQGSLTWREAS